MGSKIVDENVVRERLTYTEQTQMTMGPAITTITFMVGDATVARKALKSKLAKIIIANPWLVGKLEKGKDKLLYLVYPTVLANYEAAVEGILDPTIRGGKAGKKVIALDSTMSYFEICEAVGGTPAEILKGSQCINNREPLLALTVTVDSKCSNNSFAVIFSCSHVIVDGFTYYKILNMLSKDVAVEALSPKRKHSIMEQAETAIGVSEWKWMNSSPVMCNVICSMLFGSKPLVESYYIDSERVARMKAETVVSSGGTIDYVSTNDIITSSFGIATNADVLLMPLNFRDRLPDFTSQDAGNYEGSLFFSCKDFESPSLIRQTLQSGPPTYARSVGGVMPSFCNSYRLKLSMVTNWAFPFFEELIIEGGEQIVHLPHCDTKFVPFDIAVVYRPMKNKLAVVYFVRNIDRARIVTELPMGEALGTPQQMM